MSVKYPFLNLATVNEPYMNELVEASERVIRSGRYVGGPEVESFEQELAASNGSKYAVGVGNGLDALRLILRAYIELGYLHEGDEVIVPSNTYIATVLAISDNGLLPVFVEPDFATHNLDSSLIERSITARTKAIMTVHLYGRISFDDTLVDVAKRFGLLIIEDNAQAIGAVSAVAGINGSHVSGALGNAGAFSFYPTKNTGALGDAGAVTTDNPHLADAIRALRNYGSDCLYHNKYCGYNSRLDPIQAAMLRVKLSHIDEENNRRRAISAVYDANISNHKVVKPQYDSLPSNVWHQYIVRVPNRSHFREYLLQNGVETAIHYPTPPHLQPCYRQYAKLHLPIAEQLASEVVSLPISRCTSESDAAEIAQIINAYNS
jgi:dTDP-4-amino-4,6-dideoxygalactose transaminase